MASEAGAQQNLASALSAVRMLNPRRAIRMRREQEAEVEVMNERWQRLPEDILLHNILPFVRCTDLCRFRAVSTKWNRHILQPEFQATLTESKSSFLLVSAAVVRTAKLMSGNWDIFDTEAPNKQYALRQAFLTQLPEVKAKCSRRYARYSRTTVAADKGFIWVLWQRSGEDEIMCVVNPVTHSHREVPCFPRRSQNPCFAMAVASDTASFKLFVLGETSRYDYSSFVFDSRVGDWCPMSDPPVPSLKLCHMLTAGKQILTIFLHQIPAGVQATPDREYRIFAYDTEEDVWADTGVSTPPETQAFVGKSMPMDSEISQGFIWAIPQLAVCGERFFFTTWKDHMKIGIWEVDLEHKECVFVAESAIADAYPLLVRHDGETALESHIRCSVMVDLGRPRTGAGANIVLAHGTDDGRILFSSVTRSCLAFVVSDRSWIRDPFRWKSGLDVGEESSRSGKTVGWFANVMPLTLRPVPGMTVDAQPAETNAV